MSEIPIVDVLYEAWLFQRLEKERLMDENARIRSENARLMAELGDKLE